MHQNLSNKNVVQEIRNGRKTSALISSFESSEANNKKISNIRSPSNVSSTSDKHLSLLNSTSQCQKSDIISVSKSAANSQMSIEGENFGSTYPKRLSTTSFYISPYSQKVFPSANQQQSTSKAIIDTKQPVPAKLNYACNFNPVGCGSKTFKCDESADNVGSCISPHGHRTTSSINQQPATSKILPQSKELVPGKLKPVVAYIINQIINREGGAAYVERYTAFPSTSQQTSSTYKTTPEIQQYVLAKFKTGVPNKFNQVNNGEASAADVERLPDIRQSIPAKVNYTSPYRHRNIFSTDQQTSTSVLPQIEQSIPAKLKPGFAYIFNQEEFDNKKLYRHGSDSDVERLKEAFAIFKIETYVYDNCKLWQIIKKMEEIKEKDFSNHSCIIITILSHGARNEEVLARDDKFSIDDIILYPMLKNETLKDLPKILLIQACKGKFATKPMTDAVLISSSQEFHAPKEILKVYSTFEGFLSYRDGWGTGTVFIKEFCINLAKYGKYLDVESIIRKVRINVMKETKGKQVPSCLGSFTKDFIFGDYI